MLRNRFLPLVALLTLTACGSTVQLSQSSAGLQDGLGAAPGTVTSTSAATSDGTAAASTGGAVSSTGPSQAGGAGGSSTTTGALSPGGETRTSAPVTPTGPASHAPVPVGLLYLDGVDRFASALGISGLSTGDAVAQATAVVSYANAHGGLAGRRIELRTAKVNASDASSESAWGAACTSLTEDQKVSWVISYAPLNAIRLSCFRKHHVPVLDDQSGVSDNDGRTFADTFLAPGDLAPGRSATELVDALWRMGWLTPKSKVGTYVYDTPAGAEIETRYLKPALARHGLTPAASVRSPDGTGGADQSSTALKFRSAGVDRVIPIGASPIFLMESAESQGYRPEYAMSSLFAPGALLESAAPKNQLVGAKGIGWSKYLDIGSGTRPGPVSSNETLCFSIMKAAGQQSAAATVQSFETSLCSVLFVLKEGADRYGLTNQLFGTLRSAQLAPLPTDTFGVRLATGRGDGASAYRDVAYQSGCSCFQYTSGNHPTR